MPTFFDTNPDDFLTVTEAAKLVPYSRDHITLLARKNKILATNTDRRWLVSAVSLQRFYESSRHEETIRQEYLRQARQRELRISEELREKRLVCNQAQERGVSAQWYSLSVMTAGLLCGVFLYVGSTVSNSTHPTTQSASVVTTHIPTTTDVPALSSRTGEVVRVPTSQSRPLSQTEAGFLLLADTPAAASLSEDFFSDEVTVEMIDERRGLLSLEGVTDAPELIIWRLPSGTSEEVNTRDP